ncbi:PREDICTED: LOW QUALITY PROTEIN: olfactory receptor 2AJ1-like [Hipposideros armiger]|uniref:LOW QUALITY PROTEIN: olfactory receptor 2AJ1-like n=1 Tax=Hipposideros armiger TaxID=186990 RepID=A0A8B7QK54_HIPAR|nr:PREDICTED: LOW QUALITY PROTEIN: olfactory receptor 2AJ1-like [Hipposideros armiger]
METGNHTFSSNFILLGHFSSSRTSLVFFFIVIIFIMTITENTVIILLICRDLRIHTPMYSLLRHLSFMDILHSSNIVPKIITDFLSGSRTISFASCGFQIFLSLTLLGGECLLLVSMSYDCYVAICHPLHYPILMNDDVSLLMATGCWLVGTINSTVHRAYALHFPFCGSRAIDHFFCQVPAILKLSCVDTTKYEWGVYVSCINFLLTPFSLIFASCVQILLTILQMKSPEAQTKSFSTCSVHMIVVITYYGPFIFTYMRPKSYHLPDQDKLLALFYTILTPTVNPLIYSFQNKDVLEAMKNMLKSNFLHKNSRTNS